MSETIGRVDFIVDLDGTALPAQARRIGETAGAIAGGEFNKSFTRQLGGLEAGVRQRFRAIGTSAGRDFGDSFQKALLPSMTNVGRSLDRAFANGPGLSGFRNELTATREDLEEIVINFEDVEDAIKNTNDSADQGTKSWGRYTDSMFRTGQGMELFKGKVDDNERSTRRLRDTFGSLRNSTREVFSSLGDGIRNLSGFNGEMDKADKGGQGLLGTFRQLPHGIKQAIFYVSLFAGLAGEIAVLGSVAGSSLAVLGTIFGALGTGALVAIVGFQGMLGPLSELGPNARAASIELRGIGESFAKLQEGLRETLFRDMAEPFRQVAAIAPAIQGNLNGVAAAMRDVMAALAGALGSTRGLEVMNALLAGFAPIIRTLGTAFISLGAALGTVFVAAIPSAQLFASFLDRIFAQFNNFLKSAQGQNALADFFNTLNIVMPSVAGLLASVGQLLAGLVTPTTIALLVSTLDTLSRFMPALQGILLVIADLNPIGILATLLETVGTAMTPLLPAFSTLAVTIRDGLMALLPALAPLLTSIIGAVIPLAQAIAAVLIPALITLIPAFQQIATEVLPLVVDALILVLPLVPQVAAAIVLLVDVLVQIAVAVMPIVVAALEGLIAVLQFLLTPTADAMAAFNDFKNDVIRNIDTLETTVNQFVDNFVAAIGKFVSEAVSNLNNFANGARDAVRRFVTDGVNGLNDFANGARDAVRRFITDGINGLMEFRNNAVNAIVQFGANAINAMVNFRNQAVNAVANFVNDAINNFNNFRNQVGAIFNVAREMMLAPLRSIGGEIIRFFQGIPAGVRSITDQIVGFFTGLPGRIMGAIGNLASQIGSRLSAAVNIKLPFTATGGVFNGAQARVIGEAGAEAVVPLNRPLSQVDPAVRELSAFAQGLKFKGSGSSTGEVSTDNRRQVTVAEGAIRVYSPDAKYSGVQVLDQLVENL